LEESILTIPNILSISRIFLTPFFSYFLSKEKTFLSFILLIIVVITDALDGFIARFFYRETKIGKILDHVIDKFVIAWIVITLYFLRDFPLWALILIISRDLISILIGIYILKKGKIFGSNIFGKISGFLFAVTTLLFLFNLKLRFIFLYLTISFFLIASFTYLRKLWKFQMQ
jgi:CDP-diacylglycerol--glycerol-3-phosphate 3-phosphatidyltransferase